MTAVGRLRELADWLEIERKKERSSNPKHHIIFVKPGETMKKSYPSAGITIWLHYRMEHGSWPREETCFLRHCQDYLETRYCSVVQDREEAHHHQAHSTMADKVWKGLWEKESKVHRAFGPLQTARVVCLAVPRWSRRWRVLFAVNISADVSSRNNWKGETKGYPYTKSICWTCFKLAVA